MTRLTAPRLLAALATAVGFALTNETKAQLFAAHLIAATAAAVSCALAACALA
jgi:hypothetical protein